MVFFDLTDGFQDDSSPFEVERFSSLLPLVVEILQDFLVLPAQELDRPLDMVFVLFFGAQIHARGDASLHLIEDARTRPAGELLIGTLA